MAGLRIHRSNRLERLADLLAEVCRPPLVSPFEPERIVVPNAGMARWLALQLSDRLGVCANVDFPLPASFAWDVWRAVLEDVPDEADFTAPVLTWRIFTLLAAAKSDPAFEPLAAHLRDADELRRFELAAHVAEVFDQYLVYRPDVVLAWEDGRVAHPPESRDERWQAELWRRLTGPSRPRHRARLAHEFARAATTRLTSASLPERVAVFGIPALAPLYVETFRRVAEVADVHLFVVDPCRAYWLEILPPSEIARATGDADPAELHYETGNPLLASMGRQGRDFLAQLVQYHAEGEERFEEPAIEGPAPRMLDVLHADILDLRTRGESGDVPPMLVADDDRSVQIHSCHSPMREVEVLHDQLLDLFRLHPDLEPSQVRVMTPDIETYAPLVDAVFGTASERRRIPFAIADRPSRSERSTLAAFLGLLDLPGGRFEAARLLGLLETEAVRRRFDLEEGDLPRLAGFVRTSGIRWGVDAASRAALALPALSENTWRFGLDRLMLGHAMAGRGERLFDGILPCDDVEGGDAALMARLHAFAEEVFATARALESPRTAEEWQVALDGLLSRFFAGRDAQEDVETLRAAVRRLVDEVRRGGGSERLPRTLILHELDRLLRQPGGAWAFLSGAVTFCTMVPMRNVPADVVCVLGMNDDAYPRSRRPPGFDLVSRHPRSGDRSRRDDDRYLFLEALLSARRVFYASYVGRSIRDNGILPPSILVGELAETLDASCRRRGAPDRPVDVRVTHPLQAFSPRYFAREDALFSYAQELCDAAEAARAAPERPTAAPPFLGSDLGAADDEWRTVRLETLLRFYRNPTRYFLRDRLGVVLDEAEALIESHEPFRLDGLELYQVRERLTELALAGHAPPELRAILRASGALPHGLVGERALESLSVQVERVARRVGPLLPKEPLPPATIDAELGGLRLVGSLSGLGPQGWVEYGFGAPNGRDHLVLWIRHLVLNVVAPPGVDLRSRRVSDEGVLELRPVPDARPRLGELLGLYWQGLHRPLRLFPDQSFDCLHKSEERVKLDDLTADWNPYPRLAFRGRDPGGEEFVALAREVFGPLLEAVAPDA